MAALLLSLTDIALTFGGDPLFTGAALDVAPGARIALVGRNGSGKSTLLKVAAGLIEADSGKRFAHPGATVRYLAQEPDASAFATIADFVYAGLDSDDDQHTARMVMGELGVIADAQPQQLSGGELRRAALAQVLAAAPDILLLDEPTNHLDLPAITWLEDKLRALPTSLIVISHDRRFLENVTNQTVWVDRGVTHSINQGFAGYEAWRDKFLEEEQAAHHKLGRKIAAEEDWIRYGVTARRKRNMRRVAELKNLRAAFKNEKRRDSNVKFSIAESGKSGKRAIGADAISKSFDGRKIVDKFSTRIARGEKVGFVGPNGAGKTTLLNMLSGKLMPDEGSVELGANLETIFLDQKRAGLDPTQRLADAIADGRGDWVTIGGAKKHVATYLEDFLFSPQQWRMPISALSGGERGRLALAAAMAKPSNLLVLDEPTNDLDLETLDLLEERLASYEGAILLVSHDRSFLDHLVTSIITTDPETPGRWRRYAGGYDDMVAQRGSAPGVEKGVAKKARLKSDKLATPPKEKATKHKASNKKLSYKEKYALENLPREIETLQKKIATSKKSLNDPGLFERNPEEFNKLAKLLEELEQQLADTEDQWLELELKREDLEQPE